LTAYRKRRQPKNTACGKHYYPSFKSGIAAVARGKNTMNRRAEAKEKTRRKAITAARKAFATTDYHAVTIRGLADMMKMSTGAIFGNFTDKADLWRASMPLPVPADVPVTRAAEPMLYACQVAYTTLSLLGRTGEASIVMKAIELATTPLDGDAWARHLATKAGVDAPRFPSPQAASLAPSDDAAD